MITLPQPDPNNPGGRMGGGSGPRTGNTSPGRGALEVSSTPEDSREAWRFSGRGSCPRRVRHPVGEHLCGKGPSVNRRWGFAPICDRVSPLSSVHEASVCSRAARFPHVQPVMVLDVGPESSLEGARTVPGRPSARSREARRGVCPVV